MAVAASTAALIGAGVAASVALASQYLAHRWSRHRDIANQRRDRLNGAIEKAALALMASTAQARPHGPPSAPGSLAARSPELVPLFSRSFDTTALLAVHFGREHPLLESYIDALMKVARSKLATSEMEARIKRATVTDADIDRVARAMADGTLAVDGWIAMARYAIDHDVRPGKRLFRRSIEREIRKQFWLPKKSWAGIVRRRLDSD